MLPQTGHCGEKAEPLLEPVGFKFPFRVQRLDAIVGDETFFDWGTLGKHGVVPGWPGADVAPPQPMVAQTRDVLEAYAAAGGAYREIAWPDVGHSAHLERPAGFLATLREHIGM